jgi:hypothetical protein
MMLIGLNFIPQIAERSSTLTISNCGGTRLSATRLRRIKSGRSMNIAGREIPR